LTISDSAVGFATAAKDIGSGYGSDTIIDQLCDATLRDRLILLRVLIETARTRRPADAYAAGLQSAYSRLAELQQSHPEQVTGLLRAPIVGSWLDHVLRRVDTDQPDRQSTPLWADLGYLGWLAAAAAVTTTTTEATLPAVVRNGVVMLPGLGLARLGSPSWCGHGTLSQLHGGGLRLSAGEHTVVVHDPADDTSTEWWPARRVDVDADAAGQFQVWLDDLDPFRLTREPAGTDGSQPDDSDTVVHEELYRMPRLTASQAQTWQRNIADAVDLLDRNFPQYLRPMRRGLHSIVPLNASPAATGSSYTSEDGLGAVYTTAAIDTAQLALTLIHEFQHSKLGLLLGQTPLIAGSGEEGPPRLYAPWRDDPRPIAGLLHGIYAFFGVADFWRILRTIDGHRSQSAHIEYALWSTQVQAAITQAQESDLLTPDGHHFLHTLVDAMAPWAAEQMRADAAWIASESAIAHHTFWRVRNWQPNTHGITELAARQQAGHPPPPRLPVSHPVDQTTVPQHHQRLPLPFHLKNIGRQRTSTGRAISDGDQAYLAGDYAEAAAHYQHELDADPLRPQAWAGLTLTLPHLHPDLDITVLHRQPEVLAHLHQARRSHTDTVALLQWLTLAPAE
jgi:HEXXH motif-containing protein